MTENKEQVKRKKLVNLDAAEYEHPLDRAAIETLESIPGVRKLVEKIWEKFLQKFLILEFKGSNIQVTEKNYPDIYSLLLEACSILNIKSIPPLYLENNPRINAGAYGAGNPFIGITYGAIERLDKEELLFVLAHELGHIKSGHVLYYNIAQYFKPIVEIASQLSLGLAGIAGGGFQLALNHWQRMSEFTADRAGLLVCQDNKPCIRAMIKIAGLPLERVNIEDFEESFLKQAIEFKDFDYGTMNKFIKFMSTYDNSHPWPVLRASEFIKWVDSDEYKRILKGEKIKPLSTNNINNLNSIFCEKCGNKLSPADMFCGSCGSKIGN